MKAKGLSALALALLLSWTVAADDAKLPDAKAFDKTVIDTLREVHNRGADLYNTSKDYAGAYRMYQGALATVRPLLAHRPDTQKIIDAGLDAADKESDPARKAFVLHDAIEAVRKNLKVVNGFIKPEPKPDDPKPEDKKEPEAKEPPAVGGSVEGLVTLKNQPLAGGEVTLVSLNLPKPRVFTAKTAADATYKFAEAIPPGQYAVTVSGKGVPEKFTLVTTTGLRVEVKAGQNRLDFNL